MGKLLLTGSSFPPSSAHHQPKPRPTPSYTTRRPGPPGPTSSARHHPLLSSDRRDLSDPARPIQDFLAVAESAPAELVGNGVVAEAVVGLLREGELRRAVEVMGQLEELGLAPASLLDAPGTELLKAECRRSARSGKLKEFVEVMEVLSGYGFNVKDFVEPLDITKLCVKKREPGLAVRYASVLPHAQILFSSIIYEFGKKRDLVSALIAFDTCMLRLDRPNMHVCRTIIDVCGTCGDYLRSRCIFEELLSQKITPNTYVFNSLMNVNAHDLSYTLHVYKQMQILHVPIDMTSYNILLKACCLAARVDLVQEIYKEIKHMASCGTLTLDVITYSTIIKVFADAKMWQMALKIKEDMLADGVTPNVVTWSSLISAFAQVGFVEQAVQVFQEMVECGCKPNSQCCNTLLYACVESHQFDRAFRFFSSWKKNGFQKFHKHGNFKVTDAKKGSSNSNLIARVPFTPTVATYNIMMKACGTDYHRASALMDEMKVVGLSPNQISWSILINIFGSANNVGGAMQALRTMRESGIKPDVVAYTSAIKACVQTKNMRMAFFLYEEMKRYHIRPNLVTYNTLLRARRKYGSLHEVQQCMATYLDMRKAGYNPNDSFLKELIEEWCEGVIGDSDQSQGVQDSTKTVDTAQRDKYQTLLLEKVAALLHKDIVKSPVIDLQGLSKVEARIIVLAVLRMIKENYALGVPAEGDMVVIFGNAESRTSATAARYKPEVREVIINMLWDELGIEVLAGSAVGTLGNGIKYISMKESLHVVDGHTPRRPPDFGRLTITKESLYEWLLRREGTKKVRAQER